MKERDYRVRGWLLTLAVALAVALFGAIPSFELFGMQFERVSLFDTLSEEESMVEYSADIERLEQELATLVMPEVEAEQVDSVEVLPSVTIEWLYERESVEPSPRLRSERVCPDTMRHIVPIEDFDTAAFSRYDAFIDKLASGDEVRIAFLGDSFVEGDILTSDLRAELQELFGGRGVGFVACDIPFATVRRTVSRISEGWSSYSVMKPKSAPESLRDKFFISGYLAKGGVGAATKWSVESRFATLDSLSRARILLLSEECSRVEVALSDTLRNEIALEGDSRLREIYVEAPLTDISIKVLEGEVLCYGVSLEGGSGVMVDNFSVRSNNGHAIFGTGAHINRQIDDILGYDLVVLQYGLNIMQAERRDYSRYRDQLRDMIAYAERCFPDAAVMVMGVSDRWVKDSESKEYKPIGTVEALSSYQRAAADSCGVAFWNTAEAMKALGGMSQFVANGWAAKDYTHINFRGGRSVAEALMAAIRSSVYDELTLREEVERREAEARTRELRAREAERLRQIEAQVAAVASVVDSLGVVLPTVDNLETLEE